MNNFLIGHKALFCYYKNHMNAKLLEHLVSYRENYRVQFAKTIICQKIIYQFEVISKRKESFRYWISFFIK